MRRCLQTTMDYCGIAHPGDNSKSGLPIEAVFHFQYIISFVYSKTVSNIPFIYLLTRPNWLGGSSDTCLSLNDWTGYFRR